MRTQTVPNHVDGHRDVKWGLDVLAVVATLAAIPLGAAWYLSARLTMMEVKLESATRNTAEIQAEMSRRVDEAAKLHATFLTRDEFMAWLATQRSDK